MPAVRLASLALLFIGAFAPAARAQLLIRIDGSSSVYPLAEAVAREFQVRERGKVRVTVAVSGTSGGFRKFCRGETDVQTASRPILADEMRSCRDTGVRYFEIPVAFDALTVAVHPQNSWVDSISLAQLRAMWQPEAQGRVTRWSDVDPGWPPEPLVLLGAGPDSGTFDYFTEAVVGRARESRRDFLSSEDDGAIVAGIATNRFALGFLPHAYVAAHADRIRALPVDAGAGPVQPLDENVLNGSYVPLSRPLFLYVRAEAAQRGELRAFVELLLSEADGFVRSVGYVPLPRQAYELARENFRRGRLGTAFGGRPQVGLRVEEMLTRPTRQ